MIAIVAVALVLTVYGALSDRAKNRRRAAEMLGPPQRDIPNLPADVTITALDSGGHLDENYIGTVHLTSTDPNATLPVDFTFKPSDHGTHKFSGGVTFKALGVQTLTVTDTVTQIITGSQNVTVGYSFNVSSKPVRVYVSGDNLLLFTPYSGYDPEVFIDSGLASRGIDYLSYPRARTFTTGFRIAF